MKYVQTTFAIILAAFLSISCSKSALDMSEDITSTNASELSKEDLSTALKTVIVNYPVTAVNDDETTEEVNSDEQLGKIISRNTRPKIEFPFDITIDGEIYTIEGINDLRELLKRPKRNRPPFRFVFPITVINADDTTTIIEDQEAFKAYHQSLEEGVKPTFQFPISIEDKEGIVTEIENEEDFKAYMNSLRSDHIEERKPPFKLVFPITVINADDTTTLIESAEDFKTYRETLEEGVKPTFQFPISVENKEGVVTEIESEEALKEYMEANRPDKRSFKLIFPVTVINADDTTTLIENEEDFKAYRETLEEGVKPTFQFPISVENNDGNVTEIESEEAFKEYIDANRTEKNRRPKRR